MRSHPTPLLVLLAVLLLSTMCPAFAGPLHLTTEETRWLAAHPVLRMGVGVAFPPFQYVERQDATPVFKGMASDYAALIERRLGVRLEPVFGIPFGKALEMGRTGEIDLFPCITRTPEREEFLTFTGPYLSYPLVVVGRQDAPVIGGIRDLGGRRVAVVQALANYSKFINDLPDAAPEFVFVDTVADKLQAVALGRADYCVGNLAVVSHLIEALGLTNLRVVAPTPWENNDLAMAVPKDRAILAGILEKTLQAVPREERDAIGRRWITLESERLVDLRLVLVWGLGGGVVLAGVILLVLFWNRTLRAEVRRRIRTEEELRASRKHYHELFESMFSGFAVHEILCDEAGTPTDYRFLEVNPAFERLTGLTAEQVLGRTVNEVLPETEPFWIERYGKVALTGEPARFEEYSAVLDRHYEIAAYSPGPGRFATIFTDVTERVRAREMLVQSEKMLSLGGLAAGMAHEINNPLGGILQSAQNIQRRLDPGFGPNRGLARECGLDLAALDEYMHRRGVRRMLDGITSSGKRAARIVASMLSFSRDEGTSRKHCRLADIVDDALDLAGNDYNLRAKHDFRSVRIERDYDPEMPAVPCSRTQIEQVVLNILRNAAQALSGAEPKPQEPTIRISIAAEASFAVLRIADNGPGLDEAAKKRIFEPFYTTQPPGEGTGLGLSLSYYIITQNHGGSFTLDSAPGQGAAFTIRLPLD